VKVCILGAGPCGLTAAWELAKNGIAVTVIEKAESVGGLCRTFRRDGYQFDMGGHRFISRDGELVADVRKLMGDELLSRTRKSVIRLSDRQYDYPLNLRNVLGASSIRMNLEFAAGYLAARFRVSAPRSPEGSFGRWADERFGRELSDFFFRPYTEKLWGISVSELSGDWAAQRIPKLDVKNVLLGALGIGRGRVRSFAPVYLYPRRGIGDIFETMEKEIVRLGGEVLKGSTSVALKTEKEKVSAVEFEVDGQMREAGADRFLSTIPIDELARCAGVSQATLPYRSLRFINVMLDMENLSPNTWMYVPERRMVMTRIQEPKRRSPHSAPEGKSSVMLEIPCDAGDETWNMDDAELLSKAVRDMKSLGFDIEKKILGFFSTRASHAYPRYETGYKERVEKLAGSLKRYRNLSTLGRQGLFRYIFMDTAMLMGRNWARNAMGRDVASRAEETDNEQVLHETLSVAS